MESGAFEILMAKLRAIERLARYRQQWRLGTAVEEAYTSYCALTDGLPRQVTQAILLQQEARRAGVLDRIPQPAKLELDKAERSILLPPDTLIKGRENNILMDGVIPGTRIRLSSTYKDEMEFREACMKQGICSTSDFQYLKDRIQGLQQTWDAAQDRLYGWLNEIADKILEGQKELQEEGQKGVKYHGPSGESQVLQEMGPDDDMGRDQE